MGERTVLSTADLRNALAAIKVTAPVRSDEVTPSTNATAASMAEDGAPEWTLVAAGHQTEGRGRLGREWVDVPGRALMCSVVLRPTTQPNKSGLFSLLAGASMAGAIRDETGLPATCKWPNDVLLGHAKVGGILMESNVRDGRFHHVVLGVGVNLDPPAGVPDATGLGDVEMRRLFRTFLVRLHDGYVAQEPSLVERVRATWMPVSATIGQLVEARTTLGEVVVGRAVDLDDFGGLRLSTDSGTATVAFGDIEHLAEPV
jgi:BirA family biotin operon repressor/biotin-[acetyl-CoA-carboxylase] ligase